jgi:quinol monooxygenase YgiN
MFKKGYVQMAKFALLVEMKATPGKEAEIEAFLRKEASLVRGEPGTLSWHAAKIEGETGIYRVFDTFDDEAAREAHLNGEAGQEFVEKAGELFSEAKIKRLQVVAQK